jgi:hypothetical protein
VDAAASGVRSGAVVRQPGSGSLMWQRNLAGLRRIENVNAVPTMCCSAAFMTRCTAPTDAVVGIAGDSSTSSSRRVSLPIRIVTMSAPSRLVVSPPWLARTKKVPGPDTLAEPFAASRQIGRLKTAPGSWRPACISSNSGPSGFHASPSDVDSRSTPSRRRRRAGSGAYSILLPEAEERSPRLDGVSDNANGDRRLMGSVHRPIKAPPLM